MKRRKMTYRELLNNIDKRDESIRKDIEFTKNWISTVEQMLNWFLKFILSKRKHKKFFEYVEKQKKGGDAKTNK